MQENQQNSSNKVNFIFGIVSGVAIVSLIALVFILVTGKGDDNQKIAGGEDGVEEQADDAQVKNVKIADITSADHIYGSFNSPVKIVEYTDLECPFCKRNHTTLKGILDEYDGDVAWIVRHFPLVSLHPKSPKEAEAVECAAEQNKNSGATDMVDKIFEVTPGNNGLDLDILPDLAEEIGLDKESFQTCLDSGKFANKVQTNYQDAINAGGQGTPFNVIVGLNGSKIPLPGAYPADAFRQIIDNLLAK